MTTKEIMQGRYKPVTPEHPCTLISENRKRKYWNGKNMYCSHL